MPGKFIRSLIISVLLTALTILCLSSALTSTSAVRARVTDASLHQAAFNQTPKRGCALWPGSRFTETERARSVRRGLEFIYRTALDKNNFETYGSDSLWCFYTVGASVSDASVRRLAHQMGVERARRWRQTHRALPDDADSNTVIDFAFGGDAADSLGLRDDELKRQIRRAASRFSARDFLLFDPTSEPPPADVPEECEFDHASNPRGAKFCRLCQRSLKMRTPQDVWYDALITTYTGDRYGVRLGADYGDVLKWLPTLRPYHAKGVVADAGFYDNVYAVTHVVYTLNDYGLYQIPPALLPQEFEFLKSNLREAIKENDPDMLGEFMDSLRAFGMTDREEEIRAGIAYLLAHQNADGSWGDMKEKDIYKRYHPTWNAVAALSNYAWRAPTPTPRKLRLLHSLGTDGASRMY